MKMMRRMRLGALLVALSLPLMPLKAQAGLKELAAPSGETGLVPVRTDAAKGRILLTLPRPSDDLSLIHI